MTDEKQQPARAVKSAERQQRLAAELRANLLKRKSLSRSRRGARESTAADEPAGRPD
jgi:hypothetical protein